MREKIEKCLLNIPLPVEIVEALQKVKRETGAPMNFIIEKAVRKYLFGEDKSESSSPTGA